MGKKKCRIRKAANALFKEKVQPFLREKVLPLLLIAKVWGTKVLKFCGKLVYSAVRLASFAALVVLPFMSNSINHALAQWLWYPAATVYLIFAIIDLRREKEPIFKDLRVNLVGNWGIFGIVPVTLSVFVINYYDVDYLWCWVVFAMLFCAAPVFLFTVYYTDLKTIQRSDEERRTGAINIFKHTLLYWLYDLLFMAFFNEWDILIYVFGIIAVVVIFYNATKVFLKEIKLFQSLLPFEFISGLVLAVCLIYKIPEKTLQNIVLTIVAAVVGGLITLLGVAWTIKSNYKDKRNDDRKKNIPYIAMGALDTTGHAGTKIKIEEHGYFLSAHMLSDTIFIFKGVLRDNQFVKAEHLIAPKSDFSVQMNIQDYDEVYLIGSDVLGNHYSFALSCYIRENSKTKMVASIGLPQESDCIEMLWV